MFFNMVWLLGLALTITKVKMTEAMRKNSDLEAAK